MAFTGDAVVASGCPLYRLGPVLGNPRNRRESAVECVAVERRVTAFTLPNSLIIPWLTWGSWESRRTADEAHSIWRHRGADCRTADRGIADHPLCRARPVIGCAGAGRSADATRQI